MIFTLLSFWRPIRFLEARLVESQLLSCGRLLNRYPVAGA